MSAEGARWDALHVSCQDHLGQRYTFDLGPPLTGGVSGGVERFLARDVSSNRPELEPGQEPPRVCAWLSTGKDPGVLSRWREVCDRIVHAGPNPSLLRLIASGPVLSGKHAGRFLIATEVFDETLARRLPRDRAGLADLEVIYHTLSRALFHLHMQGQVHGAVSPEAVVLVPANGSEPSAWKLAPALAPPGEGRELSEDVAGVGEVVFRGLNLPAPAGLESLRGSARSEALAAQWESLRFGEAARQPPTFWQRLFGRAQPQLLSGHAPAEWHGILTGCLPRDPAARWDCCRLMLAGEVPVVSELRLAHQGRTRLVSWDAPRVGEVALFEYPQGAPQCGQVVPQSALTGYGEPILSQGTSVQLPGAEVRRLQALTILGGIAVAGADVTLTPLLDVANLQVHPVDGKLWVTWEWPEGAQVVSVVIRTDRFATTPVGERYRHEIARQAYASSGGLSCPVPVVGKNLYVTAFTTQRTRDGMVASSGATAGARWQGVGEAARVSYTVEWPGGLFGTHTGPRVYGLWLKSRHAVVLPGLRLVGGVEVAPEAPEDGVTLVEFPAGCEVRPGRPRQLRFRQSGEQTWRARLFACGEGADRVVLEGRRDGERLT